MFRANVLVYSKFQLGDAMHVPHTVVVHSKLAEVHSVLPACLIFKTRCIKNGAIQLTEVHCFVYDDLSANTERAHCLSHKIYQANIAFKLQQCWNGNGKLDEMEARERLGDGIRQHQRCGHLHDKAIFVNHFQFVYNNKKKESVYFHQY